MADDRPGREAQCPDCHIERADYEGPDGAWLPNCPNCASSADPVLVEVLALQAGIVLPAWGLLSKWGFHDGDEPEEYLDWLDEHGLPYPNDWHGLLRVLVRAHLMPQVRENIELVDFETIHNPIRARAIDGKSIDDRADNDGLIADVAVSVPFAEVYDLQRALDGTDG